MTWLETMVNRALNDPYLNELTRKLELKYAHKFFISKRRYCFNRKRI